MAATHQYARTETELTRLRIGVGNGAGRNEPLPARAGPPAHGAAGLPRGRPPAHAVALGLRGMVETGRPPGQVPAAASSATSADCDDETDRVLELPPNLRAAIAIVEHLTGRRVQLLRADDLNGRRFDADGRGVDAAPDARPAAAAPAWQISFDIYRRIEESETTTVSAHATVTTDSGETREVSLELHMSRRFVEESLVSIRLAGGGEPVDPLVVTLAPTMASFGSDVAHFDLDLDGQTNEVRLTAGHSAYLVDDRDGNGQITDGSELFGPRTGDGFAELAALDADGNGWIDAGDPAYHRLLLAVSDGAGGVVMRGLEEAGVAAIGVNAVASPFLVTDGAQAIGQIQATGMVLLTSGQVGTVQHVDLLL